MADNVTIPATGSGDATPKVAADEATYSGDTAKIQVVRLVHVAGAEGAKTVSEIADATNGLDVDVTRSALPTGASTSAKQDTIIGHLDLVETLLAAIETAVEVIDNAIAGTEMQVDVLTLPALSAGTNNIGDVDVLSVIPGAGATSLGKAEDAAHATGDVGVMALAVRKDTGAAIAGTDGDYSPPQLDAVGNLRVNVAAVDATAAGASIFRSLDLDETEEEVKATAGTVFGMWVTNTAATTRWIKFYNATAATVVVGTTTPVLTIGIPGNTSDDVSGVFNVGGPGVEFATAITVAATTGVADADTGAPLANEVIVNIFHD